MFGNHKIKNQNWASDLVDNKKTAIRNYVNDEKLQIEFSNCGQDKRNEKKVRPILRMSNKITSQCPPNS